jgi:hypothetical protein
MELGRIFIQEVEPAKAQVFRLGGALKKFFGVYLSARFSHPDLKFGQVGGKVILNYLKKAGFFGGFPACEQLFQHIHNAPPPAVRLTRPLRGKFLSPWPRHPGSPSVDISLNFGFLIQRD